MNPAPSLHSNVFKMHNNTYFLERASRLNLTKNLNKGEGAG